MSCCGQSWRKDFSMALEVILAELRGLRAKWNILMGSSTRDMQDNTAAYCVLWDCGHGAAPLKSCLSWRLCNETTVTVCSSPMLVTDYAGRSTIVQSMCGNSTVPTYRFHYQSSLLT